MVITSCYPLRTQGWMSWEIFRCNLNTPTDDCSDPTTTMCISEALYKGQADAMAAGGFAAAGYASIHMVGASVRAAGASHKDPLAANPLVLWVHVEGSCLPASPRGSPYLHQDLWRCAG